MSFKRDGDDHGWLHQIRKRRIDELLSEEIPEDEALLMKNGRFCCTVCHHRPIFDTVAVLANHRQGKKHQTYAEKLAQDKLELEVLKMKREQQQFLGTGQSTTSEGEGILGPGRMKLVTSAQYDPRVKKKKIQPQDRKPCLDLEPCSSKTGNEQMPPSVQTSVSGAAFSILSPYIKNSTSHHPMKGLASLNTGSLSQKETVASKKCYNQISYDSHLHTNSASVKGHITQHGTVAISAPSTISQYVKHKLHSNKTETLQPYNKDDSHSGASVVYNQATGKVISGFQGNGTILPAALHTSQYPKSEDCSPHARYSKKETNKKSTAHINEEKQNWTEKYLEARGAGWKKDLSGNWVREDGVEFDSDEEPPDLP